MEIATTLEIAAPRTILLSGTGAVENLLSFARRLSAGCGIPPPRVTGWDAVLRLLLDPDETCWHDPGLWCLLLVRFEDWDHFADYLRGQEIEPSYALVEKKAEELCSCVGGAARRSRARLCVCIQAWSQAAVRCARVNDFFEGVARRIAEGLADLETVTVIRQHPGTRHE